MQSAQNSMVKIKRYQVPPTRDMCLVISRWKLAFSFLVDAKVPFLRMLITYPLGICMPFTDSHPSCPRSLKHANKCVTSVLIPSVVGIQLSPSFSLL